MWSPSPPRGIVGLLLALLVSAAFAGCFGDEDAPDPTKDQNPGPSESPIPTPSVGAGTGGGGGGGEEKEEEQVPEAHYHHHWGNPPVEKVVLFEGTVTLDMDECQKPATESEQRPACIGERSHIGSVIFDPEDDAWQIDSTSRETHLEGHVDTVFSGAKEIQATFEWDDPMLGDTLRFYYKPANSPIFLPREDQTPHILTATERSVKIPVGPGMADPAHQYWVSRWSFMLVAEGGPQENWEYPIRYANGTVDVKMEVINGGKESIDPPHPDPWKDADLLHLGKKDGRFEVTSARAEVEGTTVKQVRGTGHEGIQIPAPSVVPAGTEKLTVTVWVNATDELSKNIDWGLKYHGADTITYTTVTTYTDGDAGARVYEITLEDHQIDPPYEKQSYFGFGFFPVVSDHQEVGSFQGEYAITFQAHKDPTFTYYF